MNASALVDDATAVALDFEWLRAACAPVSFYGERIYRTIVPFAAGSEERAFERARSICDVAGAFEPSTLATLREIFAGAPDAAGAVATASMDGTLTDAHCFELHHFFEACARVDALWSIGEVQPLVSTSVDACAQLLKPGRQGRFAFYLDDGFDRTLADARAAHAAAQAEYDALRGRQLARIADALQREIPSHEFVVMRADLRGALPDGVRVVREAPTYFACEVDHDDASRSALERRDRAARAVIEAERAVRATLASQIATHARALDEAMLAFGQRDVTVAAAHYAQRTGAVAPQAATGAYALHDARFPPTRERLQARGRTFTPLSIAIDDVAVLTGPNMGGKTVCLRTVGFAAMAAAFGLPVPAESAALRIPSRIVWLGAGIDEQPGSLLSSFASEVVRLRDLMQTTVETSLVLLDEFARTTTPREGRALLVAVLASLRAGGAHALAATHLDGVAQRADVAHFAVGGLRAALPTVSADVSVALDALARAMDYAVHEVRDGDASATDAIALAVLLGLDPETTRRAYEALEG